MQLKSKIDAGEFILLAEMDPPKGVDVSTMIDNAKKVKGIVDGFIVPEMGNAVMRMSALGGALLLQKNGMDTVMQICCRDRNRLALQADLLAASASDINHIMVVTGEDPSFGDHHQAKAVYDIDIFELLGAVKTLQGGQDMAGIELSGTPKFVVGSTVNTGLTGEQLEAELEEMKKKSDAGVDFFVTPPLFDIPSIEPFLSHVDLTKTHIMPTVLLLKSVGMARYMARNVKHVHIPDDMIRRIQKAPDKVRACVGIAAETVRDIKKHGFSGVSISTIGWENKIPEILEKTTF